MLTIRRNSLLPWFTHRAVVWFSAGGPPSGVSSGVWPFFLARFSCASCCLVVFFLSFFFVRYMYCTRTMFVWSSRSVRDTCQ